MSGDEILNLPKLGLDDEFKFRCKECGKCCRQRHDIILTPYDLFRIAGFLGRTTIEIVERYCEVYEGSSSHFPIVRIVPVSPDDSCPFLRNKKCVVHMRKPVVCRIYPLARLYDEGETRFVYSGAGCKHEPRSITVREWIADVASEESEQAGILWGEIVSTIHPMIEPDTLKVSKKLREFLLNTMLSILYLSYDIKQPFVSQLQRNYEALKSAIEKATEQLSQSA
jgi:hypothetical protein